MTSLQRSAAFADLLSAPLEELAVAAFAKARERPWVRGDLLAQGLHPPHEAVSRPLRLLHLRPGARPRGGALPEPRRGDGHRRAPGATAGCTEALFTLGERPELRYDEAARWLAARGYHSTVDYVASAAQMVLEATGLLPHANAGALFAHELRQLREVSASQGMMLESLADLAAHRLAPDKDPAAPPRDAALRRRAGDPLHHRSARGHRRVPREQRLDTLEAIRAAHEEFGHVQEVIVQNFLPKPRTAMANEPAPVGRGVPLDDRRGASGPARRRSISRPRRTSATTPRGSCDFGIDDFGGHLAGHRRPRQPRAGLARGRRRSRGECDSRGFNLVPRLTVYPRFIDGDGFLDEKVRPYVLAHADASFLARDDRWASGSDVAPPEAPTSRTRTSALTSVLARYQPGYELDRERADHLVRRARRGLQRRRGARGRPSSATRRRRRSAS